MRRIKPFHLCCRRVFRQWINWVCCTIEVSTANVVLTNVGSPRRQHLGGPKSIFKVQGVRLASPRHGSPHDRSKLSRHQTVLPTLTNVPFSHVVALEERMQPNSVRQMVSSGCCWRSAIRKLPVAGETRFCPFLLARAARSGDMYTRPDGWIRGCFFCLSSPCGEILSAARFWKAVAGGGAEAVTTVPYPSQASTRPLPPFFFLFLSRSR